MCLVRTSLDLVIVLFRLLVEVSQHLLVEVLPQDDHVLLNQVFHHFGDILFEVFNVDNILGKRYCLVVSILSICLVLFNKVGVLEFCVTLISLFLLVVLFIRDVFIALVHHLMNVLVIELKSIHQATFAEVLDLLFECNSLDSNHGTFLVSDADLFSHTLHLLHLLFNLLVLVVNLTIKSQLFIVRLVLFHHLN